MPQDRRPYDTAPKDGTPVRLWADDEGPYLMYWDPSRRGIVSRKTGVWVAVGAGFTWCDEIPAGAPTHWSPLEPIDRQ